MIRKATHADFNFMFYLYMHPQVNPFLLYEPMNAENFLTVFNDLEKKGVLYIFEDQQESIGMFKLVPQHYRNTHMEEIKVYAKKNGFLRIELTVATTNEKAIQLYLKAGFHHEGVLKKYTYLKSKDHFVDEAVMAYLF